MNSLLLCTPPVYGRMLAVPNRAKRGLTPGQVVGMAVPLIMGAGRKLISLSEPRRLFSKWVTD